MAVSVDSIQTKLVGSSEDREVRVSVSQLKQKLGVASNVRLVIEPDATEPVLIETSPPTTTSSPPPPPTTTTTEKAASSAPPPPVLTSSNPANNVFMKRNIKVREWASFSGSTPERKTSNDEPLWVKEPLWEKEEVPAEEAPETRYHRHSLSAPAHLL